MNMRRTLLLAASHAAVGAAGFAAGIYALPIIIAPAAPSEEEITAATTQVLFSGQSRRDLKDSHMGCCRFRGYRPKLLEPIRTVPD